MSAANLVSHVGNVTSNIRGVAVGFDHHTIFVVAKRRAAQPPRTVRLIQVAVVLQHSNRAIYRARFEQ